MWERLARRCKQNGASEDTVEHIREHGKQREIEKQMKYQFRYLERIKFKYRDEMSNWKWRTQSCVVSSVEECKRIYGFDNDDVEYEILEVKDEK